MTEFFLILHKVRGEPAFDIAIRMTIGSEEGWIIPTSGHRAYPYRTWNLDDLYDGSDMDMPAPLDVFDTVELPVDHPDHYEARPAPTGTPLKGLLEKLGLRKPKTNLSIRGF